MGGCFAGVQGGAAPVTIAQVGQPGKLKLIYFPIAGRAEPIRLAMVLGKLTFEDRRISGEEWQDVYKAQTPFGQVPVLFIDEEPLAQTKAILRYVGSIAHFQGRPLYPSDRYLAAKVDEAIDAFDDLWILLAPTFRITDQATKETARRQLFAYPAGPAAQLMAIMERRLGEADGAPSFAVPRAGLTVADLVYFAFLNFVRSGFVDGLGPTLLGDYPRIKRHKEMIAAIPEVKQYYLNASLSNPVGLPFYEVYKPGM